jgi:hypothetical protein
MGVQTANSLSFTFIYPPVENPSSMGRGDPLMSKFPHVGSQPFISFLVFTIHSNKKNWMVED